MNYKTPGVFVEEIQLFPPSVAQVETAIPVFIGYTANTTDRAGQSLVNRPIRIQSLLEFQDLFGGAYLPASYTVQLNPATGFSLESIVPVNNRRYYLFDCLRHFFDNGGGPCFIVSVGNYTQNIIYGSSTTGLLGGLRAIEKVDEPTIIAIPDAMGLQQLNGDPDFVVIGNLHKDVIAQCNNLQDRFGLLDMAAGQLPLNDPLDPILQFRNQVGTENLKYAATYYPWLYSIYQTEVHFRALNFTDNANPPVALPDATIDSLTGNPAFDGLVTQLRSREAEEQNVFSKIGVLNLSRNNYKTLSSHFETLREAVLAESTAALVRPAFANLMGFARELALAFRDLENDAGISPDLQAMLARLESDNALSAQLIVLIGFEKNAGVRSSIALARTEAMVDTDYGSLDTEDWIEGVAVNSIAASGPDFTNGGANSIAQTAHAAASSLLFTTAFEKIAEAFSLLIVDVLFLTDQAEQQLFANHPFFKSLYERLRRQMSLTPPSGAIAGIYAAVDRSRGVWKAPANVSLRSVVAPAQKLSDRDQANLNVHPTGKSVNAIRAFTGKGILVWGARTLAGNDNEWRYINVRRFFTMVEESVKKATEPFVFESNNANTWVRVRAMIENFLTLQWRQGALFGSNTREAFFVKVGLGETMTNQDILEGRMIVEIGLAVVRPAEFIILQFSHKMQES